MDEDEAESGNECTEKAGEQLEDVSGTDDAADDSPVAAGPMSREHARETERFRQEGRMEWERAWKASREARKKAWLENKVQSPRLEMDSAGCEVQRKIPRKKAHRRKAKGRRGRGRKKPRRCPKKVTAFKPERVVGMGSSWGSPAERACHGPRSRAVAVEVRGGRARDASTPSLGRWKWGESVHTNQATADRSEGPL